MKITGYFVDPENGIAEPRTIDKSLEGYYALLRCDLIDMPERSIGDKFFTIICDDEGLLKAPSFVSAFCIDGSPVLVGSLFVVKFDGTDDVTSLTQDELDYVGGYIVDGITTVGGKLSKTKFLTCVGY